MAPQNPTSQLRLRSIGWLLIVVAVVFVAKLFYLQIIQYDHYRLLAEAEHTSKYTIPATRGEIYVLDGDQPVPLVLNQTLYMMYADPRFIKDASQVADKLADATGGDQGRYEELLKQRDAYVVLERKLSREIADQIRNLKLAGIGFSEIPDRVYPEGTLAAHITGFVNDEGRGQYGVEQALDNELKGKDGLLNGATDVRGIPIVTVDNIQIPAVPGERIVLTIDRNIQAFAEKALAEGVTKTGARAGSVIVMDPRSGAIKAMANYPTFNPAEFEKEKNLQAFGNPAIADAYEPGSVVKVFTMAAGLNEGVVKPDTTYTDTSFRLIDGYTVRNVGATITKVRTMSEVIERSANTGVIFVLEQLGGGELNTKGKKLLYDYFTARFGFGKPTGIELPGEAAGFVASPERESDVRYANMSFGQGVSMTPLQLAAALSSVVNGGTYYKPYIVSERIKPNGETAKASPIVVGRSIISTKTTEELKKMMESVVQTGSGFKARRSGYRIGGKTGTAQKAAAGGGYQTDRFIGSFFGFAPSEDPRYVVIVRVDEPTTPGYAGSTVATPIFAEISSWLLEYYQIAPSS